MFVNFKITQSFDGKLLSNVARKVKKMSVIVVTKCRNCEENKELILDEHPRWGQGLILNIKCTNTLSFSVTFLRVSRLFK